MISFLNNKITKTILKISFFSIALLAMFSFSAPVYAGDPGLTIRDSSYAAKYVSQSIPDPVEIEAGESKEVIFKFKNVGTATWSQSGGKHISAYTVEPKYRKSEFAGDNWISSEQTDLIRGVVKPGEIGELKIQLKAPQKIGDYVERFYLASENNTWVKNSYFYLKIKVVEKKVEEVAPPKTEEKVEEKDQDNEEQETPEEVVYKAKRWMINKTSFKAKGGDKLKVIIGYQNLGDTSWKNYSLYHGSELSLASGNLVSFVDDKWQSNNLVLSSEKEVLPGESATENFYFRAPAKKGEYETSFSLVVDGKIIEKTYFNINVTSNAPVNYKAPDFNSSDDEPVQQTPRLKEETRIKVGIKVEEVLQFMTYEDDYIIIADGEEAGVLPNKTMVTMRHADGVYSFESNDLEFKASQYIRLEPKNNPRAVFTLMNVDRGINRLGAKYFNKYRGAVEYRIGKVDKEPYAINDLLMEDYVAGLAETSTWDEKEFVKANLTAARTYAYVSKGKYPYFDVVASTYDQLYLGFMNEEVAENGVQAAKESRGMMVTYKGEVVTTPYFGNSNGRTKSWTSVWGGTHKPWLVPVNAEYDKGRRQYGHGVGMSQRDAQLRAKNEGLNFKELLKYYYTGVEVTWMYQ